MKQLSDYKDIIHSCSKCGLCQSVCPIYKITGNDCTVSRGQFIMLKGLINQELKMTKTMNKYLDLCLKCGACSKFCPSGIDVVDIIASAKYEYFKLHKAEIFKSFILKFFLKIINLKNKFDQQFHQKNFEKKVVYFGGCGGFDTRTTKSIIKILNSINIEVIVPQFECCGYPFFIRGDMDNFKQYMDKFYKVIENYEDCDIVTNCATCERTLKSYSKFNRKELRIKNVFDYIKENNLLLELKERKKVTFHKPCHLENFQNVCWILNNTKNLEYNELEDYDKCCGFSGVTNCKEFKILSKLYKEKHNNIIASGAKIVLTSCLACKMTLQLFSFGKYKVEDFVNFLAKNIK